MAGEAREGGPGGSRPWCTHPEGLDGQWCDCGCRDCTLANGTCLCVECPCELPSDHYTHVWAPVGPVPTDQPDPAVGQGRRARRVAQADRDTRALMSWLRGRG